jgi:1A family penicillin-binding protein
MRAPRRSGSSFARGLLGGILAFLVLSFFTFGSGVIAYAIIAEDLPDAEELVDHFSTFQTTTILDREGNLLAETFDPNTGRRVAITLDQIPKNLKDATIATEDVNFYKHRGVDPIALIRALYYAVREREIVSGASTIPQQVVKLLLLTPERTLSRKIKEAVLSTEIIREYKHDGILTVYFNEIYYGNFAYGADAAAKTYFNKDVGDLTLAEAALLAGLPQLPSYYDPYTHPDRAKERQAVVLALMVEAGYITTAEADAAWLEPLSYAPLNFDMKEPHFTLYVRQQVEAYLGADAANSGLIVTTTLDPKLQEAAQRIVRNQVASLADHSVSNGALVAVRPQTGEIVAFVGSADFDNVEIDGQVNMALAPRQPGSSIKPFVYLASFEQPDKQPAERWTPGTLVADIKETFPDGANPPYVPTNYDNRERGMVTVRTALANSLNIPAVRTLQTVGLPPFLELMRRVGVTTLTRPDYGLSLALGGGEIPLVEMTGAFAVIANGGVRVPPIAILKITKANGEVLCDLNAGNPCRRGDAGAGQQVISPVDAFLVTDILSDNEARAPVFGPNSILRLDRPVAAKTGTTNDFKDNLTFGFTPQLVTGVWIGNADYTEMRDISGITGAGPIWNQFMTFAHTNEPVLEFTPPPGVKQFEVCADTGTLPSNACPERRVRWFAEDRPPLLPEKDLYQVVRLDRRNGQLAGGSTPRDAIEEKVFKIYPEPYRRWAEEHGIPQPPGNPGEAFEFRPELFIRQPVEGEVVNGVVPIFGSANAPNFVAYELQYGVTHDPTAFSPPFAGPFSAPVIDGPLGEWNTAGLADGPHTLRLLVQDSSGGLYEQRVRLFVAQATATPLPTETWTPIPPTVTLPPQPTDTPLPPDTPTTAPTNTPAPAEPTAIPTDTPPPSPEATATDTPPPAAPTATPTDTPLPPVEPTVTPTDTPTATLDPNQPTPTWTPLPALETPAAEATPAGG